MEKAIEAEKALHQANISDEQQQQQQQHDANTVWWDSDSDPENPFNWPTWKKVLNCGLVSFLTFVTPLASSAFAPGVPDVMKEFRNSNNELAGFVVSVYVLGYAVGPLVMAPMSEIYGRVAIFHLCNVGFVAFMVACALAPTLEALIAFRFVSGMFGACPITNGAGTIADMMTQEQRAAAMAAFSVGPLLGPILGPIIGGFVQQAKGWRWTFWVLVIISGATTIAMMLFMRESYAPVLLQRKTDRLRKETGNTNLRSKMDQGLTRKEVLKRAIVRPFKLLIFSPICTIFAVYMVLVYGYLYLLFSSVTFVFEESYGLTSSQVGLVYIGLGLGSLLGMFWFSVDSSREVKKKQEGGEAKPEVRLKLFPVAAVLLPAGFFIYGWTANYTVHWIGPVIGLFVIGVGNIICFMAASLYLVDAYTLYAASALAANTVVRSIAGATLPLCALQMYEVLGLGWGNSLLGFIAVAFIPVPFLIIKFGERLRTRFDGTRL
ncbi:major facilitator superfamily domain-containing protein [Xylariales sp. PMI_506]|nr:major facilitator superfamily domain-containing protein [Xylariales sp. PMI_506]